jgi:DNA repair protein RecO (recombination protein O)
LTGAELDGPPLALAGDALLSGYYNNELLLSLLHRHDPQPELYVAYRQAIAALCHAAVPAAVLRSFELELLRLLGYAAEVDVETASHARVDANGWYEYRVDEGPVRVQRRDGDMVFSGALLLGIGERRFGDQDVLRAATRLLRTVIAYHLDGRELKSRKVLVDLHRARARMTGPADAGDTQGDQS